MKFIILFYFTRVASFSDGGMFEMFWMNTQQVGQLRMEARERENLVKEKEGFLDNERENNEEIEKKISGTERLMRKLKQEYQDAERLRDTFNSDVSAHEYIAQHFKYSSYRVRGSHHFSLNRVIPHFCLIFTVWCCWLGGRKASSL